LSGKERKRDERERGKKRQKYKMERMGCVSKKKRKIDRKVVATRLFSSYRLG